MTTQAESAGAGLRSILVATAVAGALGYAIQLAAPVLLSDDASYVTFSVYWSTLYLCVAALSGVQQEITRAARPVSGEPPSAVLRQFTLAAVATVIVVVSVMGVLLAPLILPESSLPLVMALTIGVVGYLLLATFSGVLYGLRRWRAVAATTILDAGFRAVFVLIALAAGWPAEWVALSVSLPFGLAFLAVWVRVRHGVIGAFRLDVGLSRLVAHVAGTVVAAAAMGLIMSGLPMLLGATAGAVDRAALAGLILAITLTRAPIVIPMLALQSYFISTFRGAGAALLRRVLLVCAGLAAVIVAISALAWLVGPWAIGVLSAGRFTIGGPMMAVITLSAGLVALMCVTGPVLISERRHIPYVGGWVVAALATIGALLLLLPFELRLTLALLAAPALGLLVHIAALVSANASAQRD